MKKLSYILGIAALLGSTSCDSFLEEPEPAQSLPSSTAFTTLQDLRTALTGAYDAAQNTDLFATNTTMTPDIIADNGEWRGSFPSYSDIYQLRVTADNAETQGMWQIGYRVINQANLILEALTTVQDPDLTTEVANQIRGEALFLRGATHFELVRFYGKPYGDSSGGDLGVPVITEAVATAEDIVFPARSTVQEVYQQSTADLQEAAGLLGETNDPGRATRFAAIGFLAEIAWMQMDYAKAADLAGQVIAGPFSLTAEPNGFFVNEGSPEEIWAVINTLQDNPGVNGSLPTFHHVNGRGGDVVVSQDLRAAYRRIVSPAQKEAIAAAGYSYHDLRVDQLTSNDTLNIEKYEGFAGNDDDAPIQRLAQFYLMRAEALARTEGINDESIQLLNAVRTRALRVVDATGAVVANSNELVSYEAGDFASADELIEAIILERQVELAWEGDRFWDLMRLRRPVKGLNWDDPRLRWPIPQRDLDANSSLVQNPGY